VMGSLSFSRHTQRSSALKTAEERIAANNRTAPSPCQRHREQHPDSPVRRRGRGYEVTAILDNRRLPIRSTRRQWCRGRYRGGTTGLAVLENGQ
jgi:hypothetical protein